MHQRTQDAMTYVRHYGRPDLFITFTCNPKWPEIQRELFPGQGDTKRHDLIARVFKQKLMKLMQLLKNHAIFGETRCDMYTVEWQKRGLPHAHILLWLQEKIQPVQIDSFISAEFPDPVQNPRLFNIVKTHMVHGPCGRLNQNSPCMKEVILPNGRKDKVCSKNYPREFLKETQTDRDGYPLYRRRSPEDGGHSTTKNSFTIDNRWVVPYCKVLSDTFDCHINIESCSSIKCIKYVCKYINKGTDMATFSLQNIQRNEVKHFQTGRCVCSSESFWRMFRFNLHERHPAIQHLDVHLENGERVYFNPENAHLLAQAPPRNTTLTAFFKLCQEDDFARTLLYSKVPTYYTWNATQRV